MLITFSGLDGSGKSTLVDYLKESLEKDNRKVAVSHMNYDIGLYSALRLLKKKVVGNDNGTHHTLPEKQPMRASLEVAQQNSDTSWSGTRD